MKDTDYKVKIQINAMKKNSYFSVFCVVVSRSKAKETVPQQMPIPTQHS